MKTTQALQLNGQGFDHLSIQTILVPKPKPTQLLARVDAAGICTSLVKIIEQGSSHSYINGWNLSKYPITLGDEGSITLVEIGEDLKHSFQIGQRFCIQAVVDHPPMKDLERYSNHALGMNKVAVGYTLPGHLAEYILITEETLAAGHMLAVSEHLPYSHVALAEPFSCVVSALDHHVHLLQENSASVRIPHKGLKPDGLTVIIGAGTMGKMITEVALSQPIKTLLVADRNASKLEHLQTLFSQRAKDNAIDLHILDTSKHNLLETVNELSYHQGADDVIVAIGSGDIIEQAQHLVARGGVFNLFGGLKKGNEIVQLNANKVHYGESIVTGSSGGTAWDMQRTLGLMEQGQIDPSKHITQIGSLNHAQNFIQQIKQKTLNGKAVIYPHLQLDKTKAVHEWTASDEQKLLSNSGSKHSSNSD